MLAAMARVTPCRIDEWAGCVTDARRFVAQVSAPLYYASSTPANR